MESRSIWIAGVGIERELSSEEKSTEGRRGGEQY